MKAAAENLVPVTLELGGKSPAIVGEGYSLEQAAQKIMYGKCFNAGQTCVAPDYALVPKGRVDAFVEAVPPRGRRACTRASATNPDYTSIVNDAHYERLRRYLDDARERGAKVVEINPANEELDAERAQAGADVRPPREGRDDLDAGGDLRTDPADPARTRRSTRRSPTSTITRARSRSTTSTTHQRRIDKRARARRSSGGVTINDVDAPLRAVRSALRRRRARAAWARITDAKASRPSRRRSPSSIRAASARWA